MSQLKQPIFLKKIKKVINTIPGLEEQIFACRNKKRSNNPLLFIDRKDEERILNYQATITLFTHYSRVLGELIEKSPRTFLCRKK